MGQEGYIISTFLAIYHFVESINGSSLIKGEIQLRKEKIVVN